ncbi:transketolase [Candidatus Uhrbacteria bacterium]|nr:transketolase [Candidatus Uhrbacteria bacterium]
MSNLQDLAKLVRYYSLLCSTLAGSGHPTSSLSAADLLTTILFGGFFRYNPADPAYANNDRLIFSKGHASPLFYALWTVAGVITEDELKTYRTFGSTLEGHPTPRFRWAEAATGSLGQGLSIGAGMALNATYIDHLPYRTWVLLGDSEMAEGSVWEAIEFAAHRKLNNLVGIIDVNRLGQRGPTMVEHHCEFYRARCESFGWKAIVIDGHDLPAIERACTEAVQSSDQPVMIIARTLKGKGVSFIEDKEGWHGKALTKEDFDRAVKEFGTLDTSLRGNLAKPEQLSATPSAIAPSDLALPTKDIATRKAYGDALARLLPMYPQIVALDAEVSNSTYAEDFGKRHPDNFFEMYIAEQNMVGVALGLSLRGKIPFVSSFAAFLSRAFDQIRMSQYSGANIKFVGSHAGVSIGEDGPSQMALEDLAMFRSIRESVVFYPSDGMSAHRLIALAAKHRGIVYVRMSRPVTPLLYNESEQFAIGGSKTLRSSPSDVVTVIAAGVTLVEALKAYDLLQKEGVAIRVIDLYSIKPVDAAALQKAAVETTALITVEDHYPDGGIADVVRAAISTPVYSLAVKKLPMSGKPDELLHYEEIDAEAIVKKVKAIVGNS